VFIHPKTILWPTDFSPLSMKGADYAEAFRTSFGAQLHVIYVCPVLDWAGNTVPLMTGGDVLVTQADLVTPARAQLEEFVASRFRDANAIQTDVLVGTAWYEICRYSRDKQIDLIIIATHGTTGLRHLIMGSTAERVVRHAAAPVLAVKSIEQEFLEEPRLARQTPAGAGTRP
jgi:nucleotide-binding universal stress UspA family protein